MKLTLALAVLGSAVVAERLGFRYGLVGLILLSGYMFRDTVKGGINYMFNRARLGLSQFNEDELTAEERAQSIQKFRGTFVGGLWNEGNTCFINSVVQSIASCDSMVERTAEGAAQAGVAPLSSELHTLIHDVNRIKKCHHNYSTARMMAQLGGNARWGRLNQEDAQEFFQNLLTVLEKDYKQLHPSDEKHRRLTPFDGELATRVGCLNCGDMEGIRKGILSSVDLGLDSIHNSFTLDGLLSEYCSMETISDVECYRCTLVDARRAVVEKAATLPEAVQKAFGARISEIDSALEQRVIDDKVYASLKLKGQKSVGTKTKQTMFRKPMADVLMIHINRSVFDMQTGFIRKNYAPVEFPIRLNMARYITDPLDEQNHNPAQPMRGTETNEWYVLKAAVVHYGSANFGHYICFRKFNGFWWRISDDTVDLTTEAQVVASQGVFMLFYEREAVVRVGDVEAPKDEDEEGEKAEAEAAEAEAEAAEAEPEAAEPAQQDSETPALEPAIDPPIEPSL